MWTVESESILFEALCKYRPVGLHEHFKFLNLFWLYNKQSSEQKSLKEIKKQLDELYDLKFLKERESYSNAINEEILDYFQHYDFNHDTLNDDYIDFYLPPEDFEHLLMERRQDPNSPMNTSPVVRTPGPSSSTSQILIQSSTTNTTLKKSGRSSARLASPNLNTTPSFSRRSRTPDIKKEDSPAPQSADSEVMPAPKKRGRPRKSMNSESTLETPRSKESTPTGDTPQSTRRTRSNTDSKSVERSATKRKK